MNTLKSVLVQFENPKYNYSTSVNGNLSDAEILSYFIGKWFNLGNVSDNMQKCVSAKIL